MVYLCLGGDEISPNTLVIDRLDMPWRNVCDKTRAHHTTWTYENAGVIYLHTRNVILHGLPLWNNSVYMCYKLELIAPIYNRDIAICDTIKRNESDVRDVVFEILAKTVFKFLFFAYCF